MYSQVVYHSAMEGVGMTARIQADVDEFVTLPEAAKRLDISVRAARRHTEKLPDVDKEASENGLYRVRLTALANRIAIPLSVEKQAVPSVITKDDTPAVGVYDRAGLEGELRARIRDKDSEIAFLRATLTRAQENEQKALTELSDTRRENMVLIAATATGRIPGYSPTAPSTRTAPPPEAPIAFVPTTPSRDMPQEAPPETETTPIETNTLKAIPTKIETKHTNDPPENPNGGRLSRWWNNVMDVLDRSRTEPPA